MKTDIPNAEEMKTVAIANAQKNECVELRSAVFQVSALIKKRAESGYGFIRRCDISSILGTFHFITWSKIAFVFKNSGYRLMGENNDIVWADAREITGTD